MASLGEGFPDFNELKVLAKDELIRTLESMPGSKDLVIEPKLMKILDRIAGAQLLRNHGASKIFKLELAPIRAECEQRMYLCRPTAENMKQIAGQILSDKQSDKKISYCVVLIPKKMHICELIMEQEGVYGDVIFEELKLGLIPLDTDIVSLELPEFFKSFYLHGDQSWIGAIVNSLINLQVLFCKIPNIYGQGRCAKMVLEMTKTIENLQGGVLGTPDHQIGHLFLIDREIDLVTPLCTQTTYEGLVDETFGINCGYCEFGPEVTGTDKSVKLLLNCEDEVFDEIRNRHITNVFTFLKSKAQSVQTGYSKGKNITQIGQMKDFVQNELKDLKQQFKSLTIHIGACEKILNQTTTEPDFRDHLQTEHAIVEGSGYRDNFNFIEEKLDRQTSATKTLRLMCLLSLASNGLPSKDFKTLQSHFLQSYGYEHLLTLSNLKRCGLFTEQQGTDVTKLSMSDVQKLADKALKKTAFRAICKKWNLVPKDSVQLQNPNDMSYVFSGAYTPLSCKLIEQTLMKGPSNTLEEVVKLLPGENISFTRSMSAKGQRSGSAKIPNKVVLVYFLGGCTFSEIAALRLLGAMKGYKFLFATTSIMNGTSLMESMTDNGKGRA
ncbi:vacuolar protein sorting-associated protein 33B-like isoform X2 [Anneissia japonica]|uniref:vacuolar protein sorting-associated protein 33B-like isoform X2 n=1 Tax=Anneissia japonica TaxID=1529436 RepID=UPI00142581DE|nr:vacuolar protein sorting-associated protein 33B-like isoform X2 [Anneissia japonica]